MYGTGIGREGALTRGGEGTDNDGDNGEGGSEWPASGNGYVWEQGRQARKGEKLGSGGRVMCNPTRRPTDGTVPIRFGTYNIRNGRKGGLEAALRGMSQANMDLGILQETKITNGIYTRGSAGYKVIATDAPSRHRGGVALFYRPTPRFAVEAVEKCGPNVMAWQVMTG